MEKRLVVIGLSVLVGIQLLSWLLTPLGPWDPVLGVMPSVLVGVLSVVFGLAISLGCALIAVGLLPAFVPRTLPARGRRIAVTVVVTALVVSLAMTVIYGRVTPDWPDPVLSLLSTIDLAATAVAGFVLALVLAVPLSRGRATAAQPGRRVQA